MDATSLRQSFLDFFAERGHEVVPSASLIPHDPSVLFTIAGMVPFKPIFVGDEQAPWPRATSVQKCFRTVDIDIIGTTSRHCTFFEMLGNFSFGDYFKQGAIEMAWEFITSTLKLEADRLWVTVHESDDEAELIWIDHIGVDPGRIQRMGEDNFWRMGDTGPCGPCSEIFYDKGEAYGPDGGPAFGGPERFVEIWNLVFMEFNRAADGSLTDLPKKSIDTGAGLERLVPILNGTDSVFATDVFAGLLRVAEQLTGKTYGSDGRDDIALRIMADHGRAMTMLVSDGVLPANEGRGYVLRRIVRRMVMAARRAGAKDSITPAMVAATIESLGEVYPRLVQDADLIVGVLSREEEGFDRTLRAGMSLLEEATNSAKGTGVTQLSGEVAFRLHDTHGFPVELTEELTLEQGLQIDRTTFDSLMKEQRDRARAAAQTPRAADENAYRSLLDAEGPTVFVGRQVGEYSASARVIGKLEGPDGIVELFLDRSPFYAEGGGQIGDVGTIETSSGVAQVLDTVAPLPGLYAHRATIQGTIDVGQDAVATINGERRENIRRNHTATHLLHWALREVLGDHVRQQGSLVAPDRLRFDFAHHGSPSDDELAAVARLVNQQIVSNAPVATTETTRHDAESMGAIAFFGDKYGESVRVVQAGSQSLEFCGGTHVDALGQIGSFQIVSEGSIGSNTRRIEAVTGLESVEKFLDQTAALRRLAAQLKTEPEQLTEAVDRVLSRSKDVEKERDALRSAQREREVRDLLTQVVEGCLVANLGEQGADELRQIANSVLKNGDASLVALGGVQGPKVSIAVGSSSDVDVRPIVKEIGRVIGGGGGGAASLAVAGGTMKENLDEALALAKSLFNSQ